MNAELDLRGLHEPHDPDPAFVESLERQLEAILLDPAAAARGVSRRRWIIRATLGAAAAVMLVAVVGVIDRLDERRILLAPSTTVAEPPPANGSWVAHSFGDNVWLTREDGTDPDGISVAYPGENRSLEACPAFSPAGERLMLGRSAGSSSHAALEVFTVAADGRVSPLTTIPMDGIDDIAAIPCAIWAPDGRWAALGGGGAVWVVDTQTGEVRRISRGGDDPTDLEWRPGTDELAITGRAVSSRVDENTPIDIYTVSTGEIRPISDVEAAELTWSPDGTTIAYTQAVPGVPDVKSGITLIDADGTNQRPLTTEDHVADHGIGVVWSPRGDQIAYQRERTDCTATAPAPCYERSEVVLVTATDADPANPIGTERVIPPLPTGVLREEQWHVTSVTWSPDGTRLLYSAGFQGLITVPVDAPQSPIVLSDDMLTGSSDEQAMRPWIPLQQWQPAVRPLPKGSVEQLD